MIIEKLKQGLSSVLFLMVGALALLCFLLALKENNQAEMPILFPMEMEGEYSYDGEHWMPLDKETDLTAKYQDIYLKGHLQAEVCEESRWNIYSDHIGVCIYCNEELIYIDSKMEITQMGMELMKSMCGKAWTCFLTPYISTEDEIQIHLHNFHKGSDEDSYNEFLDMMYLTGNTDDILKANIDKITSPFNYLGIGIVLLAALLIGAAMCSLLMKGSMTENLFQYGLVTLMTGGYILFDNMYIFGVDEIMVVKTYGRQLCLMLSVLILDMIAVHRIIGKTKRLAQIVVGVSLVCDVLFILSSIGDGLIYDTDAYWRMMQIIICPILMGCCIYEVFVANGKWELGVVFFLQGAMVLDILGVGDTVYNEGVCYKILFGIACLVYMVQGVRYVVISQRALVREKKLQAELTDLRIATMFSQIKPHFIYNTLGTIEQFCHESPEEAAELVHKFALYLRGNFVELGNAAPIGILQELEHVRHYVGIEQVRFPDMEVTYDIQAKNFLVPALSVQPLVENAIKHGLMGLETGGTVDVATYEVEDGYCIRVKDDGVGFEESALSDGKNHIGIQNIRTRIEVMCDGKLTIESIPGKGTTATIWIPKEVGK